MPVSTKDKAKNIQALSKHFGRLKKVLEFAQKVSELSAEDHRDAVRKSPGLKDVLKSNN